MLNLSINNPEQSNAEKDPPGNPALTKNKKTKSKEPGLAHNLLNAVGQGGAVAGNLAGTTFQTLANAVGSGGQKAGLVLAGKLNRGEVPNYGYTELAHLFEEWLGRQKRGEVSSHSTQLEGAEIFLVRLKESGFLSGDYLFVFAPTNSAALGAFVASQKAPGKDYDGVALVIEQWDTGRSSLEKDLSCFVWCAGVRLGKGGAAPDYVSAWLVDLTGSQFEKRDLIEENPKQRHTPRPDATFTGRYDILSAMARSVLSTDLAGQGLPWLFSVSSVGGAGKSYLLNLVQQTYAPRLITARLDHVDYTEAKGDLISLLGIFASKFRNAGCPTPSFDKLFRQITQASEEADKKKQKLDIAREVGRIVSGAAARKVALQLSKTFNKFWFVKHVPGFIGVGATLIEMGIGLFGQLTQEQKAEIDTLLTSQPVQELTQALTGDLSRFVGQQREKYYLWRRPLLIFDTYEQAGPVVDQWLRTVLLANPAFRVLEPVVLIAGRFELLTYDSRWSEFQSGLRNFHLQPFDFNETTEYLNKLGVIDPRRIANLYELTGGLPLFLHLAANLTSESTIIKVLAERMLEEVAPDWRNAFLEMAVPDGFNLETARRFTNPKSQAEPFFEELVQASFVEYRGNLWHFLPAVRQIFLRYREMKGK